MMRILSKSIFVLTIAYCVFPVTGLAQTLRALTAEEAVRLGLEHNPALQIARAESDEAQAAYRQANAAQWPSLTSMASYTRLSDNIPEISFSTNFLPGLDTTFTLAPVELNRFYAEVAVQQTLFSGFQVRNRIRSARFQAQAAEQNLAQQESEVAFQVRQAYWGLYQAIAVRDATDEALRQVETHLRDVTNRREAGAALASDVLVVQTRRSEVRLERVEAISAVRVARLELNRLTGLPLDTEVQPVDQVTTEAAPDEVAPLVNRALEARPALAVLESQVNALEAEIDATQGAWWPQVILNGKYIYARPNQYFFEAQDAFKATWEAGVALQWNIWSGGSKSAETRQAQARLDGAKARVTAAREQVTVEVTRQYLEVQRASEAFEVTTQNIAEAQESLRMVRQQYTEGVALSAQVLDAEQALREAQARRARAEADYAVARAALMNALGQVW